MKRLHKNLRKVLAIVLVCTMLVMSMGAYGGDNKEKYESQINSIEIYNDLMDVYKMQSNIQNYSIVSEDNFVDFYGGAFIDEES